MEKINTGEWFSVINGLYQELVLSTAEQVKQVHADGEDLRSSISYTVDEETAYYQDKCLIGANYYKEEGEWDYEAAMTKFEADVFSAFNNDEKEKLSYETDEDVMDLLAGESAYKCKAKTPQPLLKDERESMDKQPTEAVACERATNRLVFKHK